jgi:MEMO1 family protein
MKIREATVAGRFYPGRPDELRRMVESYTGIPEQKISARAVLVPHAGYIYSGLVAGRVFSSVLLPKHFILIGPNHTGRGAALALSPAGSWQTPLGTVEIDAGMNRDLMSYAPGLQEDSLAHQMEHCLEVQIPFLQVLQPEFTFSAICVRTIEYKALEELGHALTRLITTWNTPVLIVTSSDMTHYENAEAAAKHDKLAIDRILAVDPSGLYRIVMENDITMCGFAPAVVMLTACLDLGASSGRLIQYTNSGEESGDYDRVVGYAGIVI